MNVVAVVLGTVLVVWMLVDSFETLLANNLRSSRWSFTAHYYRAIWRPYRRICVRTTSDAKRERLLARFGPASFLGLLLAWTVIEIVGWGFIWWGLRAGFAADSIATIGDAMYYSGVVYFSIGFGDILPGTGLIRLLTVIAGLSGLGTLGLVIGFLPSLNAAYSARERQLLLLDDLTDQRVTPVSLVQAYLPQDLADDPTDLDTTRLDAMFDDWAAWCAEIYDSHTSYPMLMWFRSKHRGHSWITGLGVVTDAAIAFAAAVPGADTGSAMRLQRQAVRLVNGLGARVALEPNEEAARLNPGWWQLGYSIMESTGAPLRSFDDSYERLVSLRSQFHPMMEAFIDELLAPRGFWGVTAADHLAEADLVLPPGSADDAASPD